MTLISALVEENIIAATTEQHKKKMCFLTCAKANSQIMLNFDTDEQTFLYWSTRFLENEDKSVFEDMQSDLNRAFCRGIMNP